MTLSEKRQAIEVLMPASDVTRAGITELVRHTEIGGLARRCVTLRSSALDDIDVIDDEGWSKYFLSCIEAAYRLIETSSTLRREWFGTK